jgi:hypothetical protein
MMEQIRGQEPNQEEATEKPHDQLIENWNRLLPCSAKTLSAYPGLTFRPPEPDPGVMISWLLLAFRALCGIARSRGSLAAENAILRHQLSVLQRERPRPWLRPADRVLWIWLSRHWSRWRFALVLIQPATVLKWHREGSCSANTSSVRFFEAY